MSLQYNEEQEDNVPVDQGKTMFQLKVSQHQQVNEGQHA